jgi:hypothetical protein
MKMIIGNEYFFSSSKEPEEGIEAEHVKAMVIIPF